MAGSTENRAQILVIDDEQGIREGCRRALSGQGYSVATAGDLREGLERIRAGRYDLVLLDVMMPDGSGIDLIGPIHQQDPDTICIVVTGFATVELAVDAVQRGAYDFVSKPFTSDQLLVAVNQGLERRRLSMETARLSAVEAEAKSLVEEREELQKLDVAKSQLMLKVAHELRAPVAAAHSYIDLILLGYVAGDELQPTLARIKQRLGEVLDLVRDLLDLARLKQGQSRQSPDLAQVPMAGVLEEVFDLLRQEAIRKKQFLQLEILDRPMILASRESLKQVWTNLISNAIKYTPEGGTIKVTLNADGDGLTGSVEDSGIGIAEEDLPSLFQEFFRTPQAKESGEIGTGLGLAIVKQIVESYGGNVEVQSQLGVGTRFTFRLPFHGAPREPPGAKANAQPDTAR